MTDSNPFFRFVWRVNALVILATALVAALALASFVAFNIGSVLRELGIPDEFEPAPRSADPRSPAPALPPQIRIGSFQAAGPVYYAPLYRGLDRGGMTFGSSSGSNYDASALNLVFFNPATNEVRRLLPDEKGLITQQIALRDGAELSGRIRALLLTYVAADTDGDGRVSESDRKRILLARPDGSATVTLADGVDALDTTWRADGASTLRFFTRIGDEVRYGEVDLDSFAVAPEKTVSLPKP